jgi:hypothetical protein
MPMGFAPTREASTHPMNQHPFDFGYHLGKELVNLRAKANKIRRIQLEARSWDITGRPLWP